MKLYHVAAVAKNRVIGKNGKLPWHFPADLKHFKELTWGSTVVMGRKTFESLGKPLPGRENFVLSRSGPSAAGEAQPPALAGRPPDLRSVRIGDRPGGRDTPATVQFFGSIPEALASVKTPKGYIIGGAEIFRQTLDQVDGLYLTRIDADYEGDAFYPEIPTFFKERKRTLLQECPRLEVIYYEK